MSPIINKKKDQKDSFKYNSISRKIYLRPRSVEKLNIGNKKDIHHLQCSNTSNNYHSRSNIKNNNVIYLNITNFRNVSPLIENKTFNKNWISIGEENGNEINEFNIDEQILDSKIKYLEKERDFVVKNIINKYQDKISKVTQEKNNLLMKYSLRNDNLRNNRNFSKKSANTVKYFKKININMKKKDDNSLDNSK